MSRIRLGMVGGGNDAFIGGVHRIASRIDDRYQLVAGALSSTPEKSRASGEALGLERIYGDFQEMAEAEAGRDDGIEAVSIVTPNQTPTSRVPAARPATSAPTRSTSRTSSPGWKWSHSPPTSRPSCRVGKWTTTHTCCCAMPEARAACSGPARSHRATRTRCGFGSTERGGDRDRGGPHRRTGARRRRVPNGTGWPHGGAVRCSLCAVVGRRCGLGLARLTRHPIQCLARTM